MHRLELTAAGVPDSRFAHLHSAVDWRQRPVTNRLGLLGRESLIFDRRYVALMPDAAWLPRAGSNAGSQGHQTDFFTLDLAVHVPGGWSVAGPGRALRESDRKETFRFAPRAPVTDIGLFAGPYARLTTDVRGVEFELLLHPGHLENVAFFADAGRSTRGTPRRVAARSRTTRACVSLRGLERGRGAVALADVPRRLADAVGDGPAWGPAAQGAGLADGELRADASRDAAEYADWDGGIARRRKSWALHGPIRSTTMAAETCSPGSPSQLFGHADRCELGLARMRSTW